jgi:uncharacterized protein with LGFP repeats
MQRQQPDLCVDDEHEPAGDCDIWPCANRSGCSITLFSWRRRIARSITILATLRQYWAQNGYPDQSFDGLPQFNPCQGIAPLYGPPPAIRVAIPLASAE